MTAIVFVVYDGLTLLDLAGAYDPVTRLRTMGFVPDLKYEVCGQAKTARTSEGLVLIPDSIRRDLSQFDYVVIPGGNGVMELMNNPGFLSWIRVASGRTTVVAFCGGALLAGAAGMLYDRKATTHPALLTTLRPFAKEVLAERIVEDGNIITAGGVTSGIDLGLFLCEKIAGRDVREKIRMQMDYHAYPYP
ncbi:DJ-1/PfpI family protein [Methanoregula sp.]|uniref:DJ-1/PfpI family protein n=1 Tax=Methanoregula sp. TaxID=2052170 RepID=UPI00356B58F8